MCIRTINDVLEELDDMRDGKQDVKVITKEDAKLIVDELNYRGRKMVKLVAENEILKNKIRVVRREVAAVCRSL